MRLIRLLYLFGRNCMSWLYQKYLAWINVGKVSEEDGFDKEMMDNFSEYCKPLIPYMQELRKVVFPGVSGG